MPARLRLSLVLLLIALATGAVSLALWRAEQDDVRTEARERARGIAAGLEERTGAAILALQGVRAGYDASPDAFPTFARVPLARPEIVAVGWAPRVAASDRRTVEAGEQVRIGAPADAPFTYPLLHQQPAPPTPDALDLGSDPSLGEALRSARTNAEPRLSAPVRLERDGRLGVFALVPVFDRDLPTATPGQRREALLGVVAGALAADELVRAALEGLPAGLGVRVTDGATVLARGPGGPTVAYAHLGGRTWRVSLAPAAASPLAPLGLAGAGLALLITVLTASLLMRRAAARLDEEQQARKLVADASRGLVLELDVNGTIVACSAASLEVLGYEPWELIGTEVYALLHPDDLVSPPNGPQRYLHKDGTAVMLDGRRLSRRDERGFVTGLVTVLHPAAPAERTAEQRLRDAVALEPDPVELFSVVAEEVARDLAVPAVAVVRFAGGFGTIAGAHEPRDTAELVPGSAVALEGDTPAAAVFRTGESVPGAAPIRIGARLWGALVAEGASPARLRELADAAQPAIAFADASVQLGALATRDALTNLPDSRAFHEQLRAETRRAQRHERALSLVLVNLDGFRRINAEHGRLAGDRALAEVARRLAATVRNGELVARLGGDQFGWILPETGGLNGWIAAERARRALGAEPLDGIGRLSASAGVCDLEEVGGAEELVARAETALVHAKASGGDATFRYSPELDGNDTELEPETDRGVSRLRALARELDAEDPGTEGHSERVARLAEKLALSSGWSPARAVRLAQAAQLHDVGKLGIDESVLRKAGPLTEKELEQIRNHPDTGAELAVNALDEEQLGWIRYHHERWDGAGYPTGLAGELIPAGARLLALAEAWDSMTSSRVYGEALGAAEALAECKRERGAQFAPEAVDALERLWALGALTTADVGVSSSD